MSNRTCQSARGVGPGLIVTLNRSIFSLRDSFDVRLCGGTGAGQQSHALAGHFPSHLAQFFGTLVVDVRELLQGSSSAKLGDSLESMLTGIPAGVHDAVAGNSEHIFALDHEGHKIFFFNIKYRVSQKFPRKVYVNISYTIQAIEVLLL